MIVTFLGLSNILFDGQLREESKTRQEEDGMRLYGGIKGFACFNGNASSASMMTPPV